MCVIYASLEAFHSCPGLKIVKLMYALSSECSQGWNQTRLETLYTFWLKTELPTVGTEQVLVAFELPIQIVLLRTTSIVLFINSFQAATNAVCSILSTV